LLDGACIISLFQPLRRRWDRILCHILNPVQGVRQGQGPIAPQRSEPPPYLGDLSGRVAEKRIVRSDQETPYQELYQPAVRKEAVRRLRHQTADHIGIQMDQVYFDAI